MYNSEIPYYISKTYLIKSLLPFNSNLWHFSNLWQIMFYGSFSSFHFNHKWKNDFGISLIYFTTSEPLHKFSTNVKGNNLIQFF